MFTVVLFIAAFFALALLIERLVALCCCAAEAEVRRVAQ